MTTGAQVAVGGFDVDAEYTVDTQSGKVDSLRVHDIQVTATWENFDEPATEASWVLEVSENAPGRSMSGPHVIAEKTVDVADPGYSGSETTTLPEQDLVETFGEGYFDAPSETDGGYDNEEALTEEFGLTFGLRATVTDSGGNSAEHYVGDTTELDVNNLPASANTGGEADMSHEEGEAELPEEQFSAEGDAGALSATVQGDSLAVDTSGLVVPGSQFDDQADNVSVQLERDNGNLDEVKLTPGGVTVDDNDRGSVSGDTIQVDVSGYAGWAATASVVVDTDEADVESDDTTVQTNLSANGAKAWESGALYGL